MNKGLEVIEARWLFDLKMNGSIRTCSYSSDGNKMYTSGSDGQVYIWDLRTRKCLDRHTDEGCVRATSLSVSPSGSMYACGADSGCVNLYKTSLGDHAVVQHKRKKMRGPLAATLRLTIPPFKSIMSLTTKADIVKFNHDGQILAIASQMKKDSLRLVHARSGTVFANWPTAQTPLRYVTDVDFSPSSGLFAIGNDRGKVLLYRMLHYGRV
jgi:U3 small nucleolar RNA-associated protein 18